MTPHIWLLLEWNTKLERKTMRPIEKLHSGDRVGFIDSQGEYAEEIIKEEYANYSDAKMALIGNIGRYCSYCENPREADALDVEHTTAKSQGGAEKSWSNFLLSCKICNSIKGSRVAECDCLWPHLNNTFLSFIYLEDGRVKVNPLLPQKSQERAENLMKLIHLERYPGTENPPSSRDFRWYRRLETWNKASKCKKYYANNRITVNDIILYAKATGHWSIWFTVFKGEDEILARLISDFPGTSKVCFDANRHYEPLMRNPENQEDPI